MPGANCAIFGCHVSRRKQYQGFGIFQVPPPSDASKENWRKALLNIITRDRVVDEEFRRQIEEGKVHICERHFKAEDIESREYLWFHFHTSINHVLCNTRRLK